MILASGTTTRARVLDLRIRLERLASAAFDISCNPVLTGEQNKIPGRLLFVVGLVSDQEQFSAHRLARVGAYIYRRSSDVLHGRVAGLNLAAQELDEWEFVVASLERQLQGHDCVAD